MKAKIKVINSLGTFESDESEVTEKEFARIKSLLDNDELGNLSLVSNGEKFYFPADIISNSIVTLTKVE